MESAIFRARACPGVIALGWLPLLHRPSTTRFVTATRTQSGGDGALPATCARRATVLVSTSCGPSAPSATDATSSSVTRTFLCCDHHFVGVSQKRWIDVRSSRKSARRRTHAPRENSAWGPCVAVVQWAPLKKVRDRGARSALGPHLSEALASRPVRLIGWSRCVPTKGQRSPSMALRRAGPVPWFLEGRGSSTNLAVLRRAGQIRVGSH